MNDDFNTSVPAETGESEEGIGIYTRLTGSDSPVRLKETEWTAAKREQYHKEHPENFFSGLSFPIRDADDVKSAALLHGHADNPTAAKHCIISTAHRLGLAHALPDSWKEDSPVEPDTPLAALYNPTPAEQLASILTPYPEDKHGWEKPQGTWSEKGNGHGS